MTKAEEEKERIRQKYSYLINKKIDDYKMVEVIGEGGEGVVFKAVDVNNGKEVVVKRFGVDDKDKKIQPPNKQKILDEIAIGMRKELDFPYLMRYSKNFNYDGYEFVVMEYCKNGDLANIISKLRKDKTHLIEKELLKYCAEAALGVLVLHVHHLAHRDIKPENVLVGNDGHVLLTDYGQVIEITREDGVVDIIDTGSLGYQAPEIMKGDPHTEACDVYSLGILFHMLAFNTQVPQYGFQRKDEFSDEFNAMLESMLIHNPKNRIKILSLVKTPIMLRTIRENNLKIPDNLKKEILTEGKEYSICNWKGCGRVVERDKTEKCTQGHEVCDCCFLMMLDCAKRGEAKFVVCTVLDSKRRICKGTFGPLEDYSDYSEEEVLNRRRSVSLSPPPGGFDYEGRKRFVSISPSPYSSFSSFSSERKKDTYHTHFCSSPPPLPPPPPSSSFFPAPPLSNIISPKAFVPSIINSNTFCDTVDKKES